jgi:hypothetical protein
LTALWLATDLDCGDKLFQNSTKGIDLLQKITIFANSFIVLNF